MTYVELKSKWIDGELKRSTVCPFGVRDLSNDECYSGNGKNRCPYFVRYDWDKHNNHIACNHPPLKKSDDLEGQLFLEF